MPNRVLRPAERAAFHSIGAAWGLTYVSRRVLQNLVDLGLIEVEIDGSEQRARTTRQGQVERGWIREA